MFHGCQINRRVSVTNQECNAKSGLIPVVSANPYEICLDNYTRSRIQGFSFTHITGGQIIIS
jgi:hypothetical protein